MNSIVEKIRVIISYDAPKMLCSFSALLGSENVANASIKQISEKRFRIQHIYVEEFIRGKGVGTFLLENVIHWAKDNGGNFIYVEYGDWLDIKKFRTFISRFLHSEEHYEYSTLILEAGVFKTHFSIPSFGSNASKYKVVSFQDLPEKTIISIREEFDNVPGYLSVDSNKVIPELSCIVFDDCAKCGGWFVVEERGPHSVHIKATYNTRKVHSAIGISLWRYSLSIFDDPKFDWVKRVYFDYDQREERTRRLYSLLFRDIPHVHFNSYSVQLIL